MQSATRLLVLLVLVVITACGRDRDTPTGPTRPVVPASPFVGTWIGPIVDSAAGSGTLRLTITEHVAISLLGSWASSFGDDAFNDSGPMSAVVEGTRVRIYLTGQPCGAIFGPSATPRTTTDDLIVEGTRMAGAYISLGCGPPRDGRMELTKQ